MKSQSESLVKKSAWSYGELVKKSKTNNKTLKTLSNLAFSVMQARVIAEAKRRPQGVRWNRQKQKVDISWKLLTQNFAAAQLTFPKSKGNLVTVQSSPFSSGTETTEDARRTQHRTKVSSDDSTTHGERYALADAINRAIDEGWKPKKGARELGKIGFPPSEQALLEFREALNKEGISLFIFSEREPCSRQHGTFPKNVMTCTELYNEMLYSNAHAAYHVVDWTRNQADDFSREVRIARQQYYEDTHYEAQKNYIEQHQDEPKIKRILDQHPEAELETEDPKKTETEEGSKPESEEEIQASFQEDVYESVKRESREEAEKKGIIGPREIKGWDLVNVTDEGNCFYESAALQLEAIGYEFSESDVEPHIFLRSLVQGEKFKDKEWADDRQIEGLSEKLDLIIAVVDTRNPQHGYSYRYKDKNGGIQIFSKEEALGTEKRIIKLAYTGDHFLSVSKDPYTPSAEFKPEIQEKPRKKN